MVTGRWLLLSAFLFHLFCFHCPLFSFKVCAARLPSRWEYTLQLAMSATLLQAGLVMLFLNQLTGLIEGTMSWIDGQKHEDYFNSVEIIVGGIALQIDRYHFVVNIAIDEP